MRISVIVPVYNVEPWLTETLDGVLREADGGVELICVDDGSTDGSGELLDKLAAVRGDVVRVVHQPNGGAGSARNAGLSIATGDWIMFLDSDDLFAKGWLAVVRTMATRHPSVQMLGFERTETMPMRPVFACESREVDVSRVVGFDVYTRGLWQYAYRRSLIDGLAFEHIIRVEDKLFQGAALLRAERVALTDAPIYGYRQRDGSVVHTNWNRENFSAELVWRIKWLKAMAAAGRTMDDRLWRYMGLCLLEYVPSCFADIADASLRFEMEGLWFDTLRSAAVFAFAPWQRFAMRVLASTRSRALAWFLCRLPYMAKHLIHFGTLR